MSAVRGYQPESEFNTFTHQKNFFGIGDDRLGEGGCLFQVSCKLVIGDQDSVPSDLYLFDQILDAKPQEI